MYQARFDYWMAVNNITFSGLLGFKMAVRFEVEDRPIPIGCWVAQDAHYHLSLHLVSDSNRLLEQPNQCVPNILPVNSNISACEAAPNVRGAQGDTKM